MSIRWVQRDGLAPYLPPPLTEPPQVEGIEAVTPVSPIRPGEPGSSRRAPLREAYAPPKEPVQSRQPALLARQVMSSPVVTVRPEAPLAEALEIVRRHGFRHLPVVSAEGRLLGLLSDRYLLRSLPGDGQVREVMSERLLTAMPETEIREVARAMIAERVGCLPILDGQGTLAGIVTTTDLLRALVARAPLDLWV